MYRYFMYSTFYYSLRAIYKKKTTQRKYSKKFFAFLFTFNMNFQIFHKNCFFFCDWKSENSFLDLVKKSSIKMALRIVLRLLRNHISWNQCPCEIYVHRICLYLLLFQMFFVRIAQNFIFSCIFFPKSISDSDESFCTIPLQLMKLIQWNTETSEKFSKNQHLNEVWALLKCYENKV